MISTDAASTLRATALFRFAVIAPAIIVINITAVIIEASSLLGLWRSQGRFYHHPSLFRHTLIEIRASLLNRCS